MPVTVSVTEADLFTALGQFLGLILAPSVAIIRAQVNRVPSPLTTEFVVMNSAKRQRLSTNTDTWDQTTGNPTLVTTRNAPMVSIQCDVHGDSAADNAWILVTMLRSAYGCAQFAILNPAVTPLYAEDPIQVPFINGEQQYEDRWAVNVLLQANVVITTPQQFANALQVGIVSVDATYKP